MASRQNLTNRVNAFKPTGKRGVLGKVYGALQKEFKQRRVNQPTARSQRDVEAQHETLAGERRETGGFQGGRGVRWDPEAGEYSNRVPGSLGGPPRQPGRQPEIAPDFRDHMRRAEEQRRRMTPPPAPTQPPIQTGPGYEQRDEPVFDHSALETPEQVPGQSTPLPEPSTASNVSNRLARNRVTARQPTEDIPPDSPRSRGMRRRR